MNPLFDDLQESRQLMRDPLLYQTLYRHCQANEEQRTAMALRLRVEG